MTVQPAGVREKSKRPQWAPERLHAAVAQWQRPFEQGSVEGLDFCTQQVAELLRRLSGMSTLSYWRQLTLLRGVPVAQS